MQWLHETDSAVPNPPPARRNSTFFQQESLRHQAKRLYHSQVGEMYNSEELCELANINGYDASTLIEAKDGHYLASILAQLEQGNAPIVFFDIDFETKGPGKHQSAHEHAAVVFGYYYDAKDKLWLLATCWNGYYVYSAEDLAKSAAQLAKLRVAETFYKINGDWHSDQGRHHIVQQKQLPIRHGQTPVGEHATFNSKILSVASNAGLENRKKFGMKIHQLSLTTNAKRLRNALPTQDNNVIQSKVEGNFLPLNEFITYLTLNLIRPLPHRYKPEELQHIIQTNQLKQEMNRFLHHLYNPVIDESIEGDIYSQNKMRSRSIIEEVSNSIDASPEAIYCTIEDGYYKIREINGSGMSAQVICTSYLLTKESSKINSGKKIGRFGIGAYVKNAHLNNESACVLVETRALGHPGYRLEFRLLNGQIHNALNVSEAISNYGTTTRVFSSEIVQKEYVAILKEHLEENEQIPIFINGERFTPSNRKNNTTSISINGIRIQKSEQAKERFSTDIKWSLPPETTISEGRNKIIVDKSSTLQIIKDRILQIKEMPYPEWALYANSIAPLVADLQATNTSLQAVDNLLNFLVQVVQQKLGNDPCVVDLPIYQSLALENIIRLHPFIVAKDWVNRIATLAPGWDTKGTQLWIADMVYHEEDEPFVYDKEYDRLFIEKNYYLQMEAEQKLELLNLILNYPINEIKAQYLGKIFQENEKNLPATVVYNQELIEHPFHSLYQQHGLLWLYGEKNTQQILNSHENAKEILLQTASLVALYPEIKYTEFPKSNYTQNIKLPVYIFRFNGDKYYFSYKEDMLFNEHFQPLHHEKWNLLKAKLWQVANKFAREDIKHPPEMDITLTEYDVLAVQDVASKKTILCNGLGVELLPAFSTFDFKVVSFQNGYFLIIENTQTFKSNLFLFHLQKNIQLPLPDLSWKLINETHLAGYEYGSETAITSLLNLETLQFVLPKTKAILVQNNYLLCLQEIGDSRWDSTYKLVLTHISGEVIFEYEKKDFDIKDFNFSSGKIKCNVKYFDCQKIDNNEYHLSLIDKSGLIHFIRAVKKNQWVFHYYGPKKNLGYPVNTILQEEKDHIVLSNLKTHSKMAIPVEQAKLFTQHNYSFHTSSERDLSLENLLRQKYLLLDQNNRLCIFNPEIFETIPLETDWKLADVGYIFRKNNRYRLSHSTIRNEKNDLLNSLFDCKGAHLGTGFYVYELSSAGNCLFSDGYIYNNKGEKLIPDHIAYSEKANNFKGQEVIIARFEDKKEYGVYDLLGNPIKTDSISYASTKDEEKGYIDIEYKNKKSILYTPYGQIENARLHGTNNGHNEEKIDDLVMIGYGQKRQLFTRAGYPFFKDYIPQYPNIIAQHVFHIDKTEHLPTKATMAPLTAEKLANPQVLENLALLNELQLNTFQYALCLRFIDWPKAILRQVAPYASLLIYTSRKDFAQDYQTIIHFSEQLSEDDKTLVLKTFNLILLIVQDEAESIAQKLINVIEMYGLPSLAIFYGILEEKRYHLAFCGAKFECSREIIDEMPSLCGQIAYYLLFTEQQLLQSKEAREILSVKSTSPSISLLDFMCAYQFDVNVLDSLETDPQLFIAKIGEWGNYADRSHFLRVLQHAVYHQADPNKHLYEREYLQNALDAFVGMKTSDPTITVQLYSENQRCVFSMADNGMGMSFVEVFKLYCLSGFSSKRADRNQNFRGGHGVGAFTAYHDAQYVRLVTGQNQGVYHCFELRPVYNEENKICDIRVSWETRRGLLKGTLVERIGRGTAAALDAARHQRTFKSHAKTVNADHATITLNGQVINQPLTPLASIELPQLGQMVLYSSVEDMITVSGLSVKPIGELDEFIPDEIQKALRKKGIIIDLPKKIPLNRERSDFIDADSVEDFLKSYLFNAYIEAYIQMLIQEKMALYELPYDFFKNFEGYIKDTFHHNPTIFQDAEAIRNNLSIPNYEKYQSMASLHELLAYLPLFKLSENAKKTSEISEGKYSLIELAKYYNQHKRFPHDLIIPPYLQFFANKFDQESESISWQRQVAFDLQNVPEVNWTPVKKSLSNEWRALVEMTERVVNLIGYKIKVGFSTIRNGSLMHTRKKSNTIYWNVFSVSHPQKLAFLLYNEWKKDRLSAQSKLIKELLDVISHELTHALLEDEHTFTHNRSFYIKQRKILTKFTLHVDLQMLVDEIKSIFNEHVKSSLPLPFMLEPFIEAQLYNPHSLRVLNNLFGDKRVVGEESIKRENVPKGGPV